MEPTKSIPYQWPFEREIEGVLVLRWVRITDPELIERLRLEGAVHRGDETGFPGELEFVPPDFLRRCVRDPDGSECIFFCQTNGTVLTNARVLLGDKASYKGQNPKRFSFAGKMRRPVYPGERIRQTCGNRFCVNQAHLVSDGIASNGYLAGTVERKNSGEDS